MEQDRRPYPEPELAQHGHAAIDFHCAVRRQSSALQRALEADLAAAGVTPETLPADLDACHAMIDAALATSVPARMQRLATDWTARDHGPTATAAFAEIAERVGPMLEALDQGPATIEADPSLDLPRWFDGVWFHRTTGGWDAGPFNGYIHGELIHRLILTRVFGTDIFAMRAAAAACAPRRDYRRVLDLGASSGHNMVALAQVFPQAEIHGVDYSLRMLEQARRLGNARGSAWRLYQRACQDTGLDAGDYDLVASYNLLHELPVGIIRQVFAESRRLLAPGGTMIAGDVPRFAEIDRLSAWRFDRAARFGGEPYWRASASADLVALAREAGFVEVTGRTIGRGSPYVLVATKPA
jgi:SAM-dependent methyltransferase